MSKLLIFLIFGYLIAQAQVAPQCHIVARPVSGMPGEASNFVHLAQVGVDVMSRLSPRDYFYLGIGRSPFAVLDFIELVVPGSAQTIPVSYSSGSGPGFLTPEYRLFLDRHFNPKLVKGRKILLVDFSVSGRSLMFFYTDFMAYLKAKKQDFDVELLLFGGEEPHNLNTRKVVQDGETFNINLQPEQIHIVDMSPKSRHFIIGYSLLMNKYKPYAPFGKSSQPQLKKYDVENNPHHELFIRDLKQSWEEKGPQNLLLQERIEHILGGPR